MHVNGTADRTKLLIHSNDNPYTSWKHVGGRRDHTQRKKKDDRKQSEKKTVRREVGWGHGCIMSSLVFTSFQHIGKRKYGSNSEKMHQIKQRKPVCNNNCHLTYFHSPACPKRALQRIHHCCNSFMGSLLTRSLPGQLNRNITVSDARSVF